MDSTLRLNRSRVGNLSTKNKLKARRLEGSSNFRTAAVADLQKTTTSNIKIEQQSETQPPLQIASRSLSKISHKETLLP